MVLSDSSTYYQKDKINLFDLSTGMVGANPIMGQPHIDVQRVKPEWKKTTDPDEVHVENKLSAGDSSSSKKSNATSLKMLLAKEMSKELESKRKPPSVVARLMGLEEDVPAKKPVLHHAKGDLWISQPFNHLKATNKALHLQEKFTPLKSMAQHIPSSCDETAQYDGVCQGKPRMRLSHDQTLQKGRPSENKSDKRDILREKFMEAKYFSTEESLHSRELQGAFEVLSSNKDLFLRFLEEPNSIYSRHMSGFHTTPAPPQTKRITVLRPVRSVGSNDVRKPRTERVNEQNELDMRMFHQGSGLNGKITSQPSRIILLTPTPGKPSIVNAKLTPRAAPFRLIDRTDLNGELDDNGPTLGSKGVVDGVIQHQQDGFHRRDDSLLSCANSNGYGGDESSFSDSDDHNSDSEIDYVEEDGGSFSDMEGGSSVSKRSWDYSKRYDSPFPGSSFSKISHFSESSVIREAKIRLSERLATVTCDEITQEKVQFSRSTCTLGEMLSLEEIKKDHITGELLVSSIRSCGMEEDECTRQASYVSTCRKDEKDVDRSPRKLPRSKSVPGASSTFDDMVANVQASSCEGCKPTKVVLISNKAQSSFKGRVSDFLFYRSKKSTRKQHSFASFHERVEVCCVDSQTDIGCNLEANGKAEFCEGKSGTSAVQLSTSTSEGTASTDVPMSLDCPSGNLGFNESLNCTRDQPSPTSVLDAPSEDSSCNEPESSGNTASKNARVVSRSSAIESVTCSLSWDDNTPEPSLQGIPRLPSPFSDVDDDQSECHILVQNIMSSAGLDNAQSSMVFAGWHLPDCPLDPALYSKVLELQERSSYQRLLFDCVNVALLEIGENALLSTFPWSRALSRPWIDTSPPAVGVEVWSILKDWIYGARMFVVGKRDNAGVMMDRIVKQEVEGKGWVKMMRSQVVDITEQIEGGVLEELVGEAVLDFAACFLVM